MQMQPIQTPSNVIDVPQAPTTDLQEITQVQREGQVEKIATSENFQEKIKSNNQNKSVDIADDDCKEFEAAIEHPVITDGLATTTLQQNEKEKIPVNIEDDDCKELETAIEHPVDGLATTSPQKVDAPIAALISAEMLIAPITEQATGRMGSENILVGDGDKDNDERVATTPSVVLSMQGVQTSTEVVKEVDPELLIMEEKGFSAHTVVMHQEDHGMNAICSQHVSSKNNSAQSFHELMENFKESQMKIKETLNKISKAKDQKAMAEAVQSPKNIHMQSEQSDDDFTREQDDFIPVISKKSRRGKDHSFSIKTIQTRQLPRKDYLKFNSHSTS